MADRPRVIGVRELKAHASAVLRQVSEAGTEYRVSVRGRPIARIEPLATKGARSDVDGMGNSRGAFSESDSLDLDDFVAAKDLWRPTPVIDG
jgi:prevent-host-death family protein